MANKEELYISIDQGIYRGGKSNLLMCQANTLTSLKRLYNLKVLARQKSDLKKILHKLLVLINSDIAAIRNKMPTSSVPKAVQGADAPISKAREISSKKGDIEAELKLIQEKLAQLNS